jgi:hypothetical protein
MHCPYPKLAATLSLLALLQACGGGGGDDNESDV